MYFSNDIFSYLWRQSWQIALLAFAISAVCFLLRNKSAHLRYLLWLIILIKCLFPPFITVPLAVLPTEEPIVSSDTAAPVFTKPLIAPQVPSSAAIENPAPVSEPAMTIPKQGILDRLSKINTVQWICLIWITGLTIFAIISGAKAVRIHLRLVKMRKPLPDKASDLIHNFFEELQLSHFPKVWLIEGIGQPFVWGLFRGSIYLPANLLDNYTAHHLKNVLGHEVSHVLRYDALINLLQIAAQGIFWFHPFVWWSNKKIREEREKCCDEMAIARLGSQAKDYSAAIVNTLVSEYKSTLPVPSLAVAGPIQNIEDRIKTIMMPNKRFYKKPGVIVLLSVLLLALIAVPVTFALTNKPNQDEAPVSSKYSASLPNGVTVELVGVCEHPSAGKQWWRPDGSDNPLAKPEYRSIFQYSHVNGKKEYDLIFKSPQFNSDVDLGLKGESDVECTIPNSAHSLEGFTTERISSIQVSESLVNCDVSLRVASGVWQTIASGSHLGPYIIGTDTVILNMPSLENGMKVDNGPITVTSTIKDRDMRLAIMDDSNNIIKGIKLSWELNEKNVEEMSFSFPGRGLLKGDKFLIQTRPYEWIKFLNVSLKPGVKTNFQIEVEKSGSIPESMIGVWDVTDGSVGSGNVRRIDLKADGSCIRYEWSKKDGPQKTEVYADFIKINNDRQLTLNTFGVEPVEMGYILDGDKMIWTEKGMSIVFVRSKEKSQTPAGQPEKK